MVDPTPETVRRLAMIRLLLARAEEDSYQAPPHSWDSINGLHDAVEMFLVLASQVLQVEAKDKMPFLNYWELLSDKLDKPLGYRTQMRGMNQARVNFKHHGNEPTQRVIEEARAAARGLLYDETPRIFGVELEEVSLADFVGAPEAKQLLESAETHWPEDPGAAFADLASAFVAVLDNYVDGKHGYLTEPGWLDSPDLRTAVDYIRRRSGGPRGDDHRLQVIESLREYDRKLSDSLRSLRAGVRIAGLGIDLRRHARFEALTPDVSRRASGGRSWLEAAGMIRSQEDFEFCRDFVVSTALRLAEFDYSPPRRDPDAGNGMVVRRD